MWDCEFLNDIVMVIFDEGCVKYYVFKVQGIFYCYVGLMYWLLNINIFCDLCWGWGQEIYGEDLYLIGELGVVFINGLQGDDDIYLKIVVIVKYFVVYNGLEIICYLDNYVVLDKDFYEIYLFVFEKVVVDVDVEVVMCVYNWVNGMLVCGFDMLLKEILCVEYGFDGYVMFDCGVIVDFYDCKVYVLICLLVVVVVWVVNSGIDFNCGVGILSSFVNLSFVV